MIKALALLNGLLATTTIIAPNETPIQWANSYDLGDMNADYFNFIYENKEYKGQWESTNEVIYQNTLGKGQYTITTNISISNDSQAFSTDFPYIPVYVGYEINNVEYLQFYLIQDEVNTFLINTIDNYNENYTCHFVYKFPYYLEIDQNEIYTSNELLFYSDICLSGNIFSNEDYLNGYNTGYDKGYRNGYQVGNQDGYANGYQVGHNNGYDEGYAIGTTSETDLGHLMLIIASTPFTSFKQIWSFDILGFNIATFVLGLLSLGIVLIIWKKIR